MIQKPKKDESAEPVADLPVNSEQAEEIQGGTKDFRAYDPVFQGGR
jgi:hypothetical protein